MVQSADKMQTTPTAKVGETVRDTLIIYGMLGRLGAKCSKSEVMEAVSASPRMSPLDWASDAISGFGFLCQSGNLKASNMTSLFVPALLLGKDGTFAILEEVRNDRVIIHDGESQKKKRLTKAEFKDWYGGSLLFAQPAHEERKTVNARLKALSPISK